MSERVIVDTSAYFALVDTRDQNHAAAVDAAHKLSEERAILITTNFVIAETHALLLVRLDRDIAYKTVRLLQESSTRIVRVTAKDELAALALIGSQRDKEYSLTDAISFRVASRLRIQRAFSYDHHFHQAGFTLL